MGGRGPLTSWSMRHSQRRPLGWRFRSKAVEASLLLLWLLLPLLIVIVVFLTFLVFFIVVVLLVVLMLLIIIVVRSASMRSTARNDGSHCGQQAETFKEFESVHVSYPFIGARFSGRLRLM